MGDFEDLQQALLERRQLGLYRELVPRRLIANGLVDSRGESLTNFGGNDYLGYAAEPIELPKVMAGSSASALVCGWSELHAQLAAEIADFEVTQGAVLFPSGFAACSGTVATLAREGDLILSDSLNHASLIDGCRLSRARTVVYSHADANVVREALEKLRGRHARAWIVTDSVFSMDGDIAPLRELCDIAERYDAELIVDEAHATGVLGASGGGACELLGVRDRVAVRIGTLSKAVGTQGGFVAGPRCVIEFLVNHCRSLIYSTSLSPLVVAIALQRIVDIRRDDTRRKRLAERIHQFHDLRSSSQTSDATQIGTPIIPIPIGGCDQAIATSEYLREHGFFVPAIRPPTVPEGTARLRVSLSANHTLEEIAGLVEHLSDRTSDTR